MTKKKLTEEEKKEVKRLRTKSIAFLCSYYFFVAAVPIFIISVYFDLFNKVGKYKPSGILLIALILFYIIRVNFLANNDKLGEVKINFYTILTQSMYPTIKAGDVVITYKEDNNQYNKGDVITFVSDMNGGITVTHRVQDIVLVNDGYSYRTKGDNNNAEDREVIEGDNVLGKVVLRIPKAS